MKKKKLTKKEIEAYSIVQSIRGKLSAQKAGKKGMSARGKMGGRPVGSKDSKKRRVINR